MRSYCGIYVDAGYLAAAASIRLTGTSYRAATEMDVAALVGAMIEQVTAHAELPLLRVHWYDAARGAAASVDQRRIGTLPRVKLRLGRTSVQGEQKGVDLKLALDLITQARNRVMDVVYLISGDDDLTEAVEEAQHLGTQVVLLAVPDPDGRPVNASRNLQMACDELLLVSPQALDAHVHKAQPHPPVTAPGADPEPSAPTPGLEATPGAASPAAPESPRPRPSPALLAARSELRAPAAVPPQRLVVPAAVPVYSSSTGQRSSAFTGPDGLEEEAAVRSVVDSLLGSLPFDGAARRALVAAKPMIPPELDRTLLLDLSARLQIDDLDEHSRIRLRAVFWEGVDSRG